MTSQSIGRRQSKPVILASPGGRLKVEFRWSVDRFVHRLWIDGAEAGQSIDGQPDDAWPPSPPIQQLSLEEIDGAPVILGVGSAGRSHWSISVETVASATDPPALRFDLACRSKDPSRAIGSRYRLRGPVTVSGIVGQALDEGDSVWSIRPADRDASTTHRWVYLISADPPTEAADSDPTR